MAVSKQIQTYAIRLIRATQPGSGLAPEPINRMVALGASPRGVQGLMLMGKVRALLGDRYAGSISNNYKLVREAVDRLTMEKVDRSTLGDLLIEMGNRLKQDSALGSLLESLGGS